MKTIVFGTGKAAFELVKLLGLKVDYYVDNNSELHGKSYLGKEIFKPTVLLEEPKMELGVYVASMYYDEIQIQLNAYGLVEGENYFNGLVILEKYIEKLKNEIVMKKNLAISKGILSSNLREVDPTKPITWEFSSFSQNGEDGIIEYLLRNLNSSNKYFIEIGTSEGIQNNTAFLAFVKNYNGIMIEGDYKRFKKAEISLKEYNLGIEYLNCFITKDNLDVLTSHAKYLNPDVMSVDIDGNDYYVVERLFELNFRPSIFVVEYNSAYGPFERMTIEYKEDFNYLEAHDSHLYYGVSIQAWKNMFSERGYRFITVDSNGVNAIFVNEQQFKTEFLSKIKGIDFSENNYQYRKFGSSWDKQFELIKNMKIVKL